MRKLLYAAFVLFTPILILATPPVKTADTKLVTRDGILYLKEEVTATLTAYCICSICCEKDADGLTAIGRDATLEGAATDTSKIPYLSLVEIPDVGILTVDDTGGAMRQSKDVHIDVRMSTHQKALEFGRLQKKVSAYYRVYVVQSGDTLSAIARKLGYRGYKKLAKINGISNPDNIQVGWILKIYWIPEKKLA